MTFTYVPCHVVFSKPKVIDGILHRGFATTDNLDHLDEQFDKRLWALGVFFHAPVDASYHPDIELYFRRCSFEQCPAPNVVLTDRDLTSECQFYPLPDVEPPYDLVFNMNWMAFKRHELFIETLQYAEAEGRPIRTLWFGYHYDAVSKAREEEFTQRVRDLKLSVDFLPTDFCKDAVNRRYAQAKCCLICSRGEGGPRVFAESLFADLPLVVTLDTRGGVAEALAPAAGLVCEPTPESIAKSVWKAIDQRDQFTPRAWALQNLTRSETEVRLREALRQVSEQCVPQKAPINWKEACFTDYDWQCRNQTTRAVEDAFRKQEKGKQEEGKA